MGSIEGIAGAGGQKLLMSEAYEAANGAKRVQRQAGPGATPKLDGRHPPRFGREGDSLWVELSLDRADAPWAIETLSASRAHVYDVQPAVNWLRSRCGRLFKTIGRLCKALVKQPPR
jgi:hypothetical protein